MPRIDPLTDPTPADRAAVVAPLDDYSAGRGFAWSPASLALALRDDAGDIVGGLLGQLHWGWLHIHILAVAEAHRGGGWGRKLVEEAERLAAEAGCHGAWVDTFSFQAPGFYEKLGYMAFGELKDYPPGQSRVFYAKSLGPTPHDRTGTEVQSDPSRPT